MLVFMGLFTVADKSGRFEWKPRTLKLDILPFLDFDMAKTLDLLKSNKFIISYEVSGSRYGLIPTFTKHQRITGKEATSPNRYPDPPETRHPRSNRKAPEKQPGNISEIPMKHPDAQEEEREKEGKEERNNCLCAATSAAPEPVEMVIAFPLNDGTEFSVEQKMLDEWIKLYPAVNVPQALRNMRGWLLANPKNRKTRSGIERFVNSWLGKEQNKAPAQKREYGKNNGIRPGERFIDPSKFPDAIVWNGED